MPLQFSGCAVRSDFDADRYYSPAGWVLFRDRVQRQWDRPAFDALAEQALAHEPGYYYFAVAEATYLLPKWYGNAGDTARVAVTQ